MRTTMMMAVLVAGCEEEGRGRQDRDPAEGADVQAAGADTARATTDAAVVETDLYEYECVADELHIFEEVRFVPGEFVDAQLWWEWNTDNPYLEISDEQRWSHEAFSLNADGFVAASCFETYDVPGILRYRLLVRR
jgi:hypothetical protein